MGRLRINLLKTIRCFVLIAIYLNDILAWGLEIDSRGDLTLFSDYRKANQEGFFTENKKGDGLFWLGNTLSSSAGKFRFTLRPELRGLLGGASALPSSHPLFLTVRSPDRFLNFRWNILSNSDQEWYGDFEKIEVSYEEDNLSIFMGRKILSLGVLQIFPIWNKLGRVLPIAPGPGFIYGQDQLGARYQYQNWAFQGSSILGPSSNDGITFGETVWFSAFGEFHFLVSTWWKEFVTGGAFAKDWGGATLRAEVLTVGTSSSDPDQQIQVGIGAEYAIHSRWTLLGEAIYLSNGATRTQDYAQIILSRFQPLRAAAYAAWKLDYKVTDLLTVSGGTLMNGIDLSQMVLIRIEYSYSEDTEMILSGYAPLGKAGTDFSTQTFVYPDGRSFGVPAQLSGTIRTYF